MRRLKRQYEMGVEERNFTGIQLIDRNDELCILYEKCNIQESILRNGEIDLRKKEEELRILKLHEAEGQRELIVTRRMLPNAPQLEIEITELIDQVEKERAKAEKLAAQLENPENTERYRKLEGNDPSLEELQERFIQMQDKIATREEKIKQKAQVLQEITERVDSLQAYIDNSREESQNLIQKVNEMRMQIKATNRKMMSTVSQLSIYKATVIQLTKENEDLQQTLGLAERNLERGAAPTAEADEEWYKMELKRMREQRERENPSPTARLTTDGRFTTAVRRNDHYIPETDLMLPKPYGMSAPFLPTEPGTTMRHIRKPKPKEIDLLGGS